MTETQDAYFLREAARLLVERRDAAARLELLKLPRVDTVKRPIVKATAADAPAERTARPPTSPALLAPILRRDGWRCRYCGRRLVLSGVIALIARLCPSDFPFPPGHHMPADRTHPAAIRVYPNVDHVHAGSVGGDWRATENLVTACTPCNEAKSNRLGWEPEAFGSDNWDGLVQFYRALVERTGDRSSYHRQWMKALGV
jgi:hypothetical protein